MKNFKSKALILTLILVLMLSLSACNDSQPSDSDTSDPAVTEPTSEDEGDMTEEEFEPFSVVTFEDNEVTYDHVPERVVSFNLHTTENLLALGLGDKIIGTAYNNAEILPEYKEEWESIPQLAEKYPSFEVLLGAGPDFVYGRSSAFGDKGVGSVPTFVENGIMPYVSQATYTNGATLQDTYDDFTFLGKLFAVEDRAEEIVNTMKDQIAGVESTLADQDSKLKVFVFDFGTDDAFTCGQSLESDIISKAGGENVFGHIEKTWVSVSWEEVVEANPDVIVINDYGDTTAEEKITFLKENAALADVQAVKDDRFVVLPLPSVFTGIRNGDAVVYLAEQFYPDLF